MKLYVNHSSYCEYTERSDEKYGSWSTVLDPSVDGVRFTDYPIPYNGDEFEVCFDADIGDKVYVLWMVYSDGDSFGTCTGKHEVLWVFKDFSTAYRAKQTVESQSEGYSLEFVDEVGNLIKLSNPAYDYFSNITALNIDKFEISE